MSLPHLTSLLYHRIWCLSRGFSNFFVLWGLASEVCYAQRLFSTSSVMYRRSRAGFFSSPLRTSLLYQVLSRLSRVFSNFFSGFGGSLSIRWRSVSSTHAWFVPSPDIIIISHLGRAVKSFFKLFFKFFSTLDVPLPSGHIYNTIGLG